MRKQLAAVSLVIAGACCAQGAAAQSFDSAYTDLNLAKCRHKPGTEGTDGGSWRCSGHAGIAVYVAEGDLRMFVSYGPNADKQPAAEQTFGNFNSVDKRRIEWRMAKQPGEKPVPFATILRWELQISEERKAKPGQVLVVTRLGGTVCHVGYVDATANADANGIARKLADERARSFDCAKDTRIIAGKQGRSIERMAEQIAGEAEDKKDAKPQ